MHQKHSQTAPMIKEINRRDIKLAYLLFFNRVPSDTEVENKLKKHQTVDSICAQLWESLEFWQRIQRVESASIHGKNSENGHDYQTLIHLHVPKSAGSSLSSILSREFEKSSMITFGDNTMHKLRGLDVKHKRRIKFAFGHISHGATKLFPQRCHYITVLRRPMERTLSLYRYCKRRESHPLYKLINETDMSFGGFLEHVVENPSSSIDADNGQIRRISGSKAPVTDKEARAPMLREALSNIFAPNMTYGLTEHFSHFVKSLYARGVITRPGEIRRNVAPVETRIDDVLNELTDRQRHILHDLTYWDQRFYDICKDAYFAGSESA